MQIFPPCKILVPRAYLEAMNKLYKNGDELKNFSAFCVFWYKSSY